MGDITLAKLQELLSEANRKQTEELKTDYQKVHEKVKKADEKIRQVEAKCLYLERKVRKNNIIIFGLETDDSNILQQTISKINELLELNITENDINNIYKIGRSPKPPIVVEFISYLKKSTVFKNSEKLKALKGTGISVSNDLCTEDRREQKVLRKHLKEAQQKNIPAKIKGHKLEIENKLYTVSDLEDTESEYESENTENESEDNKSERGNSHNIQQEEAGIIEQSDRPKAEQKRKEIEEKKRKKEATPSPHKENRITRRNIKKKKKY